ncbi:Retrovirus-related Pol polyprotein from transposon RE2 [Vitis vinifera]|uniref:Retrovirus-related Pol polyprotein from transposon RE2 n=1 Tax=Vitis vinifera TaxID=29760 RepID=A0A438H1F2_VITVI|nr:Retrovirus-related Pol polyprotein from transposon RE2 [Vitis vinifera]
MEGNAPPISVPSSRLWPPTEITINISLSRDDTEKDLQLLGRCLGIKYGNNRLLKEGKIEFDIKNAFLNGELEEEVFMTLPPGFCKEEEETRVIKNQGYQQGQSDHIMFFKQSNNGRMIILIVYVDDIILTGDNTGKVERLKKVLATEFEVKDLGQIQYFLGMEFARSRKGISISQRKPDIAFAVSLVSQYMHSPKESHLEAMYKILKYLKDWVGSAEDRRSTTSYSTYVWGNLVTWRSKKQSVIARSSVEAEFQSSCTRTKVQNMEIGVSGMPSPTWVDWWQPCGLPPHAWLHGDSFIRGLQLVFHHFTYNNLDSWFCVVEMVRGVVALQEGYGIITDDIQRID